MKIFFTLFVLFFSFTVFAESIADFEIEGMSIGDSLLDYMSEDEIKIKLKENPFIHKDNKFIIIFTNKINFKNYEIVQVTIKPEDKNYILYAIEGQIESFNNINECFIIKDVIVEELAELFNDTATTTNVNRKHPYDKNGNTMVYSVHFNINSGGVASVECYDWSEELTNKKNWKDNLNVAISSEEYDNYLQTAYD